MIANLRVGLETVGQVGWLPNTFWERRMSNYQLLQKLKKAFEKAKKTDRSFERALHFRGDMFRLEEELFEALGAKDTSRWYNCAHCDAGYPDQECTCDESEE